MGSRAIIFIFIFIFFFNSFSLADSDNIKIFTTNKNKAELVILDKVTSKKKLHTVKIDQIYNIYKLNILVKRCVMDNSKGSLDVFAYVQIQEEAKKNTDKVYLYNGWMIANHPSLNSFEHSNYDIWIKNCF